MNVRLKVDPDRANLFGVTNLDVALSSAAAMSGLPISTYREGDKQIPNAGQEERNILGKATAHFAKGPALVQSWGGALNVLNLPASDLRKTPSASNLSISSLSIPIGCSSPYSRNNHLHRNQNTLLLHPIMGSEKVLARWWTPSTVVANEHS